MDRSKDLIKIPLFSSLSEEEIGEIRRCMKIRVFKKKDTIFSEGDPSNRFFVLVSGKVKITKLSREGKEIIIELISKGDFFGGFAVLKGFPYPANAIAMEDSSVLLISRTDFLRVIERFPNIMYQVTAHLSERVREFPDTLKNIALERVESRIASLLLKLAEKTGKKTAAGETEIDMKLTKQDIAEMVGTTVETAIRVMSRLKKAGLISNMGGRIIIRNRKGLLAVVNPL
jgi:CRP/FNR family transcriptional regulator